MPKYYYSKNITDFFPLNLSEKEIDDTLKIIKDMSDEEVLQYVLSTAEPYPDIIEEV